MHINDGSTSEEPMPNITFHHVKFEKNLQSSKEKIAELVWNRTMNVLQFARVYEQRCVESDLLLEKRLKEVLVLN